MRAQSTPHFILSCHKSHLEIQERKGEALTGQHFCGVLFVLGVPCLCQNPPEPPVPSVPCSPWLQAPLAETPAGKQKRSSITPGPSA